MRRCAAVILFFLLIVVVSSGAVHRKQNGIRTIIRSAVSQRNLLIGATYRWENGQILNNIEKGRSSVVDTLRILAILAEFKQDADEKTTGDGKFILSPTGMTIDPPPHDISYFQNQLSALAYYYRKVSNQKLILDCMVSPKIVTVQHEMAYYNPGTTEEALNKGLAVLFRDAVRAADTLGVKFSGYDAFIVFHAGVGKDVDLGLDSTPKDIPSVFLRLDDLRKQFAGNDPSYKGIPVEKSGFFIEEGILLPETENQEGYEIGLVGTTVLMFGFQLGLPALWDTQTGRSGIGKWGLMDQGSGNFNGLIPAEPCAFEKAFLGWEKPIEVRQGESLQVACSAVKGINKIFKVPINEKEYFLIENRSYDPNGDGVTNGRDNAGNRIQFTGNGEIKADKPFGAIVRVDEYDFGLPGAGILIWHIDETVIKTRLAENKINSDRNHRGVDLEEADGAQDIGESYGMLEGGAGSETGVLQDAWFSDNEINKWVNKRTEVLFTPDAYPNSRSNGGANSHLVLSGFSEADTVMTFTIKTDWIRKGFPQYFTPGLNPFPLLSGDLNGDGQNELIVATCEGKIFAWKQDGSKVIQNGLMHHRGTVTGDSMIFPLALFAESGQGISFSPVVGGAFDSTRRKMLGAAVGEHALIWTGTDSDRDGLADRISDTTYADKTILSLVIGGSKFFYGMKNGLSPSPPQESHLSSSSIQAISWFESTGQEYLILAAQNGDLFRIDWPKPSQRIFSADLRSHEKISHLAVGSYRSNQAMIVLLTTERGFVMDATGMVLGKWDAKFFPDSLSAPALGDLDADGQMEIITTADGQVWAFNANGSIVDHFPVPNSPRTVGLSSPVLGDVDGDGQIEAIVTTSEGLVEAYCKDGSMADGFPLPLGGSSTVSPLLLDLDGDKLIELAAMSSDGVVVVWDLPGKWDSKTAPWPSYLHDSEHTASNIQDIEEKSPLAELMPSRLMYNYPNPNTDSRTTIRYRLENPAEVKISIFNMAGDMVQQMNGPGVPQTENEVVWDLKNIASGIYFCNVTAKGDHKEKTFTFKIAVVK